MDKKTNIILAGGGTGGHFFPAVAVAEELLQNNVFAPSVITDQRCAKYAEPLKPKLSIEILHIERPTKTPFGLIKFFISNLRAVFYCLNLYRKTQPKLVIGFGGYPSFAPLVAAFLARIPIALHEQNSYLGAVNRLFAIKSKFIALSFRKTLGIKDKYKEKAIFTGNPVRYNAQHTQTTKSSDIFTIVVTGGSQAAKVFSEAVPAAIKLVKIASPDQRIMIYHQAPSTDIEGLATLYEELGITYQIEDFFHNMGEIYGQADLCICRAGASTLAELQLHKLPAILIPYPYAAHDHQTHNAQTMSENGCGWIFQQSSLTPAKLAQKISQLIISSNLLIDAKSSFVEPKITPNLAILDLVQKNI